MRIPSMRRRNIAIDMDGTICDEMPTFQRCLAIPKEGSIDFINNLYENNNIIIFTARGWAEYEMTKNWLDRYGIKFHQLICGKPIYDIFIDDRSVKFESWDKIKDHIK
jgi:uncharacterized HAD superfamily protein